MKMQDETEWMVEEFAQDYETVFTVLRLEEITDVG
jgi:hypothetical protein